MSYFQAMRYAIIPQAVRRVIPPLMNEFVILIKDTSLVALLGLTTYQRELMTVGRDAYSETFNATPFLATAAGYLIVTLPMIRFVTWLEKRLRSGLVGVTGAGA
jgi:polar amino acid transport system permease protein